MLSVQLTCGALSDPVLVDTIVQDWLLAIDHDCIAVGLSLESPPMHAIHKKWLSILVPGHSIIA